MTDLSLGAIVVPFDEVGKADGLRIEVIEGPEALPAYLSSSSLHHHSPAQCTADGRQSLESRYL